MTAIASAGPNRPMMPPPALATAANCSIGLLGFRLSRTKSNIPMKIAASAQARPKRDPPQNQRASVSPGIPPPMFPRGSYIDANVVTAKKSHPAPVTSPIPPHTNAITRNDDEAFVLAGGGAPSKMRPIISSSWSKRLVPLTRYSQLLGDLALQLVQLPQLPPLLGQHVGVDQAVDFVVRHQVLTPRRRRFDAAGLHRI